MVIVTLGMIVLSLIVWTVAYAWAKDKYERDLEAATKEPLALPQFASGRPTFPKKSERGP